MKKVISALLLASAPFVARAETPFLYSHSAIVYDVGRGEVLLEKNADDVQPIASLTKLMTAMVVLDSGQSLGDTVSVDDDDIDRLKHSGSRIPIGASLERGEMLRLALMASENRAASALSRAFPGGQPAFIQQMNQKARALQMANTHFDDPTGLSPDDRSTARDVVKMADAAAHYPLISEYTTLPRYQEAIGTRTRFYHNTDPIVRSPDWDVRVAKTGYIREAGRCIVVDANMPNGQVMIALLGSQTSWGRSADLVTIRRWLNGDETPVVAPHYVAGTRLHHHRLTLAHSHRVKVRLASYRTASASGAHRQTVRHHAGKRVHHAPVAA
ncbi:D-alanyl-D-alanine carboxypeptidase family protein [Paraburkholderia silviterrae]|uniref:D-alanyl-D-alanine carboxypeptidase n=1 Tax=Paraburkholderia silviterrae TaxID=2528715 RepID=A0A4R5M913_9BURK|nr:serine hydrolase [Paraburkholderia silviterrae]TDG23116.1 D-alanyl-D-alanine carboxypeptidase [Paraburkholderia silviterrae]